MRTQKCCRFLLSALVLFHSLEWLQAQPDDAARSIEELQARLEQRVTDPRFAGAIWGVQVLSLDTGLTVFEHHPERLMSPASNCKLYTGALALDKFGGDYRIRTPVVATVTPDATGRIKGDLVVSGRGDPSWKLGSGRTNFWALFDPFVAVVTNASVRRITGDVIADATYFRSPPYGGSWTVDDLQFYYGTEVSAVTLELNMTDLRIEPGAREGDPCRLEFAHPHTGLVIQNRTRTLPKGASGSIQVIRPFDERTVHVTGGMPVKGSSQTETVTVPRPADWFAAAFKAALERKGIVVDGRARSVRWPEPFTYPKTAVKLGEVTSPPMRDLVASFMKPSQNLETDLIFDHIGEATRTAGTPAGRSTEDCAVAALEAFLKSKDLPVQDLQFDEGSGLSRNNLASARLTAGLLQVMASRPGSNDFLTALPIAGVDGTLRRRMKGTVAEGNVRAKTGTLRWANALSGHVTSAAGERLVFSLMLNRGVAEAGRSKRDELDEVAVALAAFAGRSATSMASLYAPEGQLILTQLVNAPFPHPARAGGHTYRDEFFPRATHYTDSTVAIFIPQAVDPGAPMDFVFYFHGWGNSVELTLGHQRLIEQLLASGRRAVLVVPAGPRFASDSFGGKLEDTDGFKRFFEEIVEVVQSRVAPGARVEPGNIILSGHSGGYHVMAAILDRGGLSDSVGEVWIFDGLYANTDSFLGWQKATGGRLLNIFTESGGTKDHSEQAMESMRKAGTRFLLKDDTSVTAEELGSNLVVFLQTHLSHGEVVAKRETFRQFLETSSLPRTSND